MPSFLGEYENCATNRVQKFHRAIQSFLKQKYLDTELIVISDGCQITINICENDYNSYTNIKLIKVPKQVTFAGITRQLGINQASGKVVCFLDTDDFIGKNHILNIANQFDNNIDWVFWDDYVVMLNRLEERETYFQYGHCGTSTIAYRKKLNISWEDCNGYGHDFKFISQLTNYGKVKKIIGCEYYCCHVPNYTDV